MKIQGYCYLRYREYLQKLYFLDRPIWCLTEQTNVLRADTTSYRINHTACQIWPTMLSAVPSLTPRHSKLQVFQQTRGAQNFSKPFKKHHIYYWVFRLIFHSRFIWHPLDISKAFKRTTHVTISSTLKFTNTLPYAWKYHRIDSTELIQKVILTSSNRGAPEFNTLEQRLYK